MHFERLSKHESTIVQEALWAAADGPFFPNWEFHTLFGLHRHEVRQIAKGWPLPNASPERVVIAVNNSFNMLLSYPHRQDAVWFDWISIPRPELNALFNRLRGHKNESAFDRLM